MIRKQTVTIEDSPMDIWISEPEGEGPHPAIVICIHAPANVGIENDAFTQDLLKRYAEAGYVCAAPFIFHWWPLDMSMDDIRPQMRDDHLEMDTNAAFAVLDEMDNVDSNRIGIIGHCMGGRHAWLAAAHNDRYKAMVVLYGGRIKTAMGPNTTVPPIDMAADIPCPVLGLFGNADSNPSPEDVDDYAAALDAAGKTYEFHRYDGANHAFQDFNRDRYHQQASDDAWEKILAFLAKHLKT